MKTLALLLCVIPAMAFQCPDNEKLGPGESIAKVTFSGGHDTDRRDGGRPIVLVAGGLGVAPDLFRKAFSGVTPARDGAPDPEQVHRNKDALLSVLAPYGIDNDRLDEVSDFYRYRPQRGELWKHRDASGYAVVADGKIVRFKVTDAGYGYSSAPTASVEGFDKTKVVVTVAYSKKLTANGSIKSLAVQPPRQGYDPAK